MLEFALILAACLSFFSQIRWMSLKVSGISFVVLYSVIWTVIWSAYLFELFGVRNVSSEAVQISIIPVIGIFIGEQIGLTSTENNKENSEYKYTFNPFVLLKYSKVFSIVCFVSGLTVFIIAWRAFGNPLSFSGVEIKSRRVSEGLAAYSSEISGLPIILKVFWLYGNLLKGLLISSMVLIMICFKSNNIKKYWIIFLPFVSASLYDAGFASRNNTYLLFIITILFWTAMPYTKHAFGKNELYSNHILTLLTVIVIYIVMNNLTRATHGDDKERIGSAYVPKHVEQFLKYHVETLYSFDKTLADNRLTFGRMSFQGVEQWLRLIRVLPKSTLNSLPELFKWEEHIEYGIVNTYSWLRYMYSDFGIMGVFLIPLILGYIGGSSVRKWVLSSSRDYFAISKICICYVVIVKSPMIMAFRDDYFIFGIVALLWSVSKSKVLQKKHTNN